MSAGALLFRAVVKADAGVRAAGNARFEITAGRKLRLPKIGDIPVRWSRELPSDPSSVTVIKDASGRYFASFVAPPHELAGMIGDVRNAETWRGRFGYVFGPPGWAEKVTGTEPEPRAASADATLVAESTAAA
ncbi:hypothetical protein ACFQZZ_19655 [Nocardia sp. GCM10030253]|uniref:hypothetical protein n=1 Tax=Nocardia sp. GCM10030253 TaxID=3273404 RepID=UPI00362553C8